MISVKKILLLLFVTIYSNIYSQSYLEFVENKGQWADNIAYKGLLQSGAIALKPDGGYRMLQNSPSDLQALHDFYHPTKGTDVAAARKAVANKLGLHSNVYEVSFLGANKNPVAVAEKPQDTYNNYYIDNDPKKWASGCKIFQAVTYKNIYPNIDVRYYTGDGSLKYDFIVNPGGNPSQIAMSFDGVDELKIKKGKLIIKTPIAEEKELAPYSFQPSSDGRIKILCSYRLKSNIVTFNVDDYDKSIPLIIDPTKVFATFSGSISDNWGFTATYDDAGCLYGGGVVFGGGFPVSNGTTYQGGFTDNAESYVGSDIGIIKFNALGNARIYATYIGGSNGNEQPHSLVVDASGNLIIAGRTNSNNYPTTLPNVGPCGGRDIIITKLNGLGNVVSSVKIGGTNDDGINIKPKYSTAPFGTLTLNRNYGDDARSEVIVDNVGNILLASCTQSTDFPVTANAFQTTNGGATSVMTRKQDAVFIKVSNDLSNLITSTYLGGNNDDAAFVLAINPNNQNIYIAGGTASNDFPGDKTGVLYNSFQGGDCDGFVSIIDGNTSQLLKSTYMGTSSSENVYGIQFDKNGFPYVMGTTTGQWPIFNAQYNKPFAKQFIAKLQPNLNSFIYSTTFGTVAPSPNISPTALLVDRCDNVYVSGWGGSVNQSEGYLNSGTSNMETTPNAIQSTTDNSDFYFFVLEKNAKSQLYGDFFGQTNGTGEHVDGGTSRFDKNGIIYQGICANCGRDVPFPTTPGAYATTNGSARCNLACIKIAFNLAGIGSGVRSSIKGVQGDTSGCVPLLIKFTDTIAQGIQYTWNFGDGSPDVVTATPSSSHFYNNIGTYTVRLISVDSSTCNIVDTSYKKMRIRSDSATLKLTYKKIGDCFSNTYEFDNRNSISPPAKPFGSKSFIINFGDGSPVQVMGYGTIAHPYPAPGIYNGWMSLVDTNYCNTPDTIPFKFNIVANIKANFTPPATGCLSSGISFTNSSFGGDNFIWHFGDGTSSTDQNPVHIFTNSGNYIITLIIKDSFSCNKIDSVSHPMAISISPTAFYTYSPVPPKVNIPVSFTNKSIGAVNYIWTFGDGDTIKTNNINQNISHLYTQTQTFRTCLQVFNMFGCTDTFCRDIAARINPLFDVPNAVSPDGINKKIFVKGFGIKKISWNIYNRWGILMFSTNDLNEGWDGKYKGEIQPQDVYHYTLLVEFYDDKKATKTGDITLLR